MSAGSRLARALEASARVAGCAVRVAGASERPWSSATFVGVRHELRLEGAPSAALAGWLEGLEGVIAVPGHVVAELVVERTKGGAKVEALTLEV